MRLFINLMILVSTLVWAVSCVAPDLEEASGNPVDECPVCQPCKDLPDCPEAEGPVACEPDDTFYLAPPFVVPEPLEWNHPETSRKTAENRIHAHVLYDELALENHPVVMEARLRYDTRDPDPLVAETVSVYIWGTGIDQWTRLGRYDTDHQGRVRFMVEGLPRGQYIVKALVEGDATSANGYLTVVERGRQTVVFNLDGAVLRSGDFSNPLEVIPRAADVVGHYADLGFQVLMYTAIPDTRAVQLRQFLAASGIPFQSIRFLPAAVLDSCVEKTAKTRLFLDLKANLSLDFVRAYGFSVTDVDALLAAGIAPDRVFVYGPLAGVSGTSPIPGGIRGYEDHYSGFLLEDELFCLSGSKSLF